MSPVMFFSLFVIASISLALVKLILGAAYPWWFCAAPMAAYILVILSAVVWAILNMRNH